MDDKTADYINTLLSPPKEKKTFANFVPESDAAFFERMLDEKDANTNEN